MERKTKSYNYPSPNLMGRQSASNRHPLAQPSPQSNLEATPGRQESLSSRRRAGRSKAGGWVCRLKGSTLACLVALRGLLLSRLECWGADGQCWIVLSSGVWVAALASYGSLRWPG